MSETATIIDVVEAVKAVQRIQPEHRHEPGVSATFFSEHDVWLYVEMMDAKVCPICRRNARWSDLYGGFKGNHLRANFPYLEIKDVNTIKTHAHMPRDDNCRCFLNRKIGR